MIRFDRVLFVFPQYKHTQFGATHPPVGLGYLSEFLSVNGIENDVVDMRLDPSIDRLKAKIRAFQPNLVGVSMMTLLHRHTYDLMEDIKKTFPHLFIVAGGPHISTFREAALNQCRAVDFGVTLEGEQTLLELCREVNLPDIKGLIYRYDDQIIYTGPRPFIAELDTIPFPVYGKFALDKYITDEIPLLTSRGCPYNCIYCPVKTAIGRQCRVRTPQHVIREIQYWHQRGRRHFGIVDDNFMMIKKRVLGLCQEIQDHRLKGLELRCPNGVRADQCDRQVLAQMRDIGFKYLAIGVEAGNNKILERLHKGEKIEIIRQAIKNACDLGYEVILFFLVGSPGETWQDIEDSVKVATSYPVFDAKFYNLIPFPDTQLFDWVRQNKYFIREPEDYLNDASHWDARPVFATPELSREDRIKALHYTASIRRQIRQKAIQCKLQKLGILSGLAAHIFILDFVQYQLLHNYYLRRLATRIFRKITN
jgi:radical SAM superfamily enzyme YgiQ (UPF0313 family)